MTERTAFTKEETHRIVWRPRVRVHASSEGLGWSSMFASAQYEAPFERQVQAVPDHLLVLHVGGPARIRRSGSDGHRECVVHPGGVVIHPGGDDFGIRLEGAVETVHVYLRHSLLEQAAFELQPSPARFDLLPRVGVSDALLEQLALGLRSALRDGEMGSVLYAEHLGLAMAAHLLRAHSTISHRSEPAPGNQGLTTRQMARTMEFIQASLNQRIGAAQVADAAALSTLHFLRQFKLSTGLPLHRYVLRARVEMARRLLTDTDRSIAEVALDCGFAHQEHLTHVFHKWCGTTPAAFRRNAAL
jgi:AraC family transcriptional regulator